MKALYLLCVLSLTACTNIDGKYVTVCEEPVTTTVTNTANNGMGLSYFVKKGDSIYAIARKFGLSPASILARNPLIDANTLKIGSSLNLPIQ